MRLNFKIVETIANIGGKGKYQKLLTLTQWGDSAAKLDLRQWHTDENGELQPAKGITLSHAEAAQLATALNEYLAKAEPPAAAT